MPSLSASYFPLQVRDQMELLRVQPIDQSIPAEDIMGRSYCRYQGPRTW